MNNQTCFIISLFGTLFFSAIGARHSLADQKDKPLLLPWEYKVVSLDGDENANARKLRDLSAKGWKVVGPLGKGKVKLRRSTIGQPSRGLTPARIKELFERATRNTSAKIDGSDNDDNHIPKGTILLYLTDENRYGYLEILENGYNLSIKWITFDKTGGVFAKGDRLLIKGTWNYDLDYGTEGSKGKSRVDFWWEQVDRTRRYVVPRSGAKFLIYEPKALPHRTPR